MYSDHRQGVKNLLTPDESKKSLDLAINAWKTHSELAPKIGKGKYVLAEYENLYITTEVESDHEGIIEKVRNLASF